MNQTGWGGYLWVLYGLKFVFLLLRKVLINKLNHTSNSIGHSGISASSDFASRNKDTYLTFILNCRSDYLVAYPQKEQRVYKTKPSRMKFAF